jgi:hypothetical protein
LSLADPAYIAAKTALNAVVRTRRLRRQTEFGATLRMDHSNMIADRGEVRPDAAAANAECSRTDRNTTVAVETDRSYLPAVIKPAGHADNSGFAYNSTISPGGVLGQRAT